MIRALEGLEPERFTSTVLRFQRGSVASIDGREIAAFPSSYDVDTQANGAGGMAYCGFNVGADYFPYVIKNDSNDQFAITLSNQISTSAVVLPSSNWRVFRKLPWGFCAVNGVYIPGGTDGVPEIPAFHMSHWPKPLTVLTQATTESNFSKVLSGGTATGWTKFPVTKLVPDNARMVEFLFEITGSGSAYVRSGTFQGEGMRLTAGTTAMMLRVDSVRELQYKVSSATLTVHVLGYHQTEPS